MTDRADAEKAIEQLKEKLFHELYNRIAKKIIEETQTNQKAINDQLTARLDNWDIMVDTQIKNKVEQEWKLRNEQPDN